ncbi:MAG: hypothetical protein IJ523_11230 [Succinivibrionaceae bacterium]|nr:hypothetical protein [Succinivibrionaceae bacterium]
MSQRYYYLATLTDAVSLSASHSSDYSQVCLDHIPGSAIAGALACRLYRRGNIDETALDRVFQNNEAVFSNALPLNRENGLHVVLPAPSCLHYEKGADEEKCGYINLVAGEPGKKQLKQVRSGYLMADGRKYSVTRHSSTKTAIDANTQSAKENQLFTINHIDAGTVFWGSIDIPDGTIRDEEIKDFLNSEIRLGKCRSSEFGRAQLSLLPESEAKKLESILTGKFSSPKDNKLFLWCLSDVEFIDLATASGTFTPQGSNLWIKGKYGADITYNPEQSFIRTARVRLFNRKRNGYDSEKCLIKRGSVICFDLIQSLPEEELKRIAREGVGLSRHQGLGRVMANPSWLSRPNITEHLHLFEDLTIEDSVCKTQNNDEHAEEYGYLEHYLKIRCGRRSEKENSDRKAGDMLHQIVDLYTAARASACALDKDQYGQEIKGGQNYGPTNSQWGELCSIISSGDQVQSRIAQKLKEEKQRDSSRYTWDIHFAYKGNVNTSFAEEFGKLVENADNGTLESLFDVLRQYDLSDLETLQSKADEMMSRIEATGENNK